MRSPSPLGVITRTVLLVGLIAITIAGFFSGYRIQRDEAETAKAETTAIAEPARDLATDVLAACRSNDAEQLAALGISCTKAADTRKTIDDSPSTAEVRYVPVPGQDGRDAPTLSQVFAALEPVVQQRVDSVLAATFARCVSSGECRGPEGQTGATGATGETGARGERGETGAAGQDGRGLAQNGVKCVDGTWQVTYTDGTTDTNAGSCSPPAAAPEPTDPEPTLIP